MPRKNETVCKFESDCAAMQQTQMAGQSWRGVNETAPMAGYQWQDTHVMVQMAGHKQQGKKQ